MTRIAIIGGGSAYMPGLAYSLARTAGVLDPATVVLQDIDPEALDLQARLTRRILDAGGAPGMGLEATGDLTRAVDGADFVLTTFRPGGLPARHLDEVIPPRHGVIGQETTGPGGLAMALRSVPALLDVAEAMRAGAAGGALLLNYTNPVQLVTEALTRYTDVDVIGLCDQHGGEIRFLSGVLRCDPHAMETDTWGTNHLTLTRAVRIDGTDATGRVFETLARLDPAGVDPYWRPVVRLFPLFGMVPNRYLQYYFLHPEILAIQQAAERTRAQEIMAELPPIVESYRVAAQSDPPQPMEGRFSDEHGDLAIGVIAAVVSGEPARFVLNVPNRGAIPGLPDDAVVELPCILRGREVERIAMGPLPEMIAGLAAQLAVHARLAARAAVEGDRRVALQAMMSHPLVTSLPAGQAMLDELLAAHAAQLTRFG